MNKTHIGNGVYAEFEGVAVVLTTGGGPFAENRIVLKPDVYGALRRYVETLAPAQMRESAP